MKDLDIDKHGNLSRSSPPAASSVAQLGLVQFVNPAGLTLNGQNQ